MARKRTNPPEPKIPLELLVERNEAETKLNERIAKGKEIRKKAINTARELDDSEKQYDKWDDFNKELLKRLFSSEELCQQYSSLVGVPVLVFQQKHLREEVEEFYEKIDTKNHRLESIIERLELIPVKNLQNSGFVSAQPSNTLNENQIFIVHGRDESAKLEVARFVEKIGFEPIILHEQASGSRTIIEKIESYSNVGFGIVIYTPCDIGAINTTTPPDLKGRARQNVVFEHGFLIGKLGRSRVCPLVKGQVETPNDIADIVYTSMDTGSWQIDLAKELRAVGYQVDFNKVI
ncbi:MAG: nucleotide-binding protein [Thermodesulfobacteriota bacterium]